MTHNAAEAGVPRYFFSSSACVYRDMKAGEPVLPEEAAIPAQPDNEYGWEKLYSERVATSYERRYGIRCGSPVSGTVMARKAPGAADARRRRPQFCRKVAEADDGGSVEVWGDGTAIRSYVYIDDLVDGIRLLAQSDLHGAANICSPEYVSVDELVQTVARAAGKRVNIRYVKGPVGVQSRNFSIGRIGSIGWTARVPLEEGIQRTYRWVEARVEAARHMLAE